MVTVPVIATVSLMPVPRERLFYGVLIFILLGLVAFFVLKDPSHCKINPEGCACLTIIENDKYFDFEIQTHPKTGIFKKIKFSVGKTRTASTPPELVTEFVECLNSTRKPIEFVDVNYARLTKSPLGQISDLWSLQNGLKILLNWRDQKEKKIINNLKIDGKSGIKWQILAAWCSSEEVMQCVECSPEPNADTVEVQIKLRENAKFSREFWRDGWPPNTNGNHEPWEDIDDVGKRYLYICGE